MYEAAFGLQKRPFSVTPDAACVFAPEPVHQILEQILRRIDESQGVAVLTGPAGTGKTLLCRRLIQDLAGQYSVAYLSSASFASRRALLQAILYEVGQRYSGLGEQELRLELRSFLKQLSANGQALVLILDEAHLLNPRMLEEVRLLANISEDGHAPLRVILAGQHELDELLAQPEQAALSQVLACQLCLEPLTHRQSLAYIAFRVNWAGGDASKIFAPEAIEAIARASSGLPRCLNQLTDHSLLLAFVHEAPRVEATHVEDALSDLRQLPLHWNEPLSRTSAKAAAPAVDPVDDIPLVDELSEAFSIEIGGDDAVTHEVEEDAEASLPRAQSDFFDLEAPVSPASEPQFESCPAAAFRSVWRPAGVVPLTAGTRQPVNLLEEEVVLDRYARIDAGREPLPVEAAPPALRGPQPVFLDDIDVQPETIIDDTLSLIDEALLLEDEPPTTEAGLAPDLQMFQAETMPLEEELHADVFDICVDVQQSILEPLSIELDDEGTVDMPYDAVEPELPLEDEPAPAIVQHLDPPLAPPSETLVPKPNYKLIFSTLRKKLSGRR
jgi:type II secretory pathway predicted ATPase ExeA